MKHAKQTILITVIMIGLLAILYINTLSWLVYSWINDPYYSHGFLIAPISGYIIWRKREELNNLEKKPVMAGIAIILIGILLHLFGTFWLIDSISGFSLIIVLSGLALYLGGLKVFKTLAFPILFLIFMVPLPIPSIENQLEVVSAKMVVIILNSIGIVATNLEAEIHLENSAFIIGAPCSGLRSLISLLTVATIYVYLLEGANTLRSAVLLTSSIPIALISNIFRITAIMLVANNYGSEVALDFFHNFSGFMFFAIALLLLLIVGRCFGRLKFKKIF